MLSSIRLAREADSPVLEALIAESVEILQADCYTPEQRAAAMGPVFGVDRQLIRDETYFVAIDPVSGVIAGCGGWSQRKAAFGASHQGQSDDATLNPKTDAARIGAFFVRPGLERRGLLQACEEALVQAGFSRATLVATVPGKPLYQACGFTLDEPMTIVLPQGLSLPAFRMSKVFPWQ